MTPSSSRVRDSRNRFPFKFLIVLVFFCSYYHIQVDAADDGNGAKATDEESQQREVHQQHDMIEDSFLDPLQADPSCNQEGGNSDDCFTPPASTIETETMLDATCFKGGEDPSQEEEEQCIQEETVVDKHWGKDPSLLAMRDQLRKQARQPLNDTRPPIFLMPGLASTRLVAWKFKKCKSNLLLGSDIKVQDNVWLNINLILQMGTVNVQCMSECLSLGLNQSDTSMEDWDLGCKLRPDEGLDAIASLAPGGIGSSLLVGGTNTVYSWLIQWLADNLGYDVTNMIGLPYDWRLSPDKMEARDGFLSMTRRRIEAAVASNGGQPGIMVAHSMGNLIFRYFLDWLREEMREEAYQDYLSRARRREKRRQMAEELRKRQELLRLERVQRQKLKLEQFREHMQKEKDSPIDEDPANELIIDPSGGEESILPGWMAAAIPGLNNVIAWVGSSLSGDENALDGNDPRHIASLEALLNEEIEAVEVDATSPASSDMDAEARDAQLRALAKEEGDAKWVEWLETHIWTYIGLSAPMLGAVNPLRSVISGENMGLPISDAAARTMEVTFGSTHILNPVSIATGFCDDWEADDWATSASTEERSTPSVNEDSRLACLDDIAHDIGESTVSRDPWENFATLKSILVDRLDWDTTKPMMDVKVEVCHDKSGKKNCIEKETLHFGPRDAESGHIFNAFNALWKEEGEPLIIKREQLEESFMNTKVVNMLNHTWERPLIKHVVMAYGMDIPTEVGYIYKKQIQLDGDNNQGKANATTNGELPDLHTVIWEESNGRITAESMDSAARGSLADHFIKKKSKRQRFEGNGTSSKSRGRFLHCGDGSVPYLSLAWVHTWLLHAARARRFGQETTTSHGDYASTSSGASSSPPVDRKNALDHIHISHRPHGALEWVDGPPPAQTIVDPSKLKDFQDTGVDHPHGTRYKPLMTRYHNVGISRTTGIEYTTTVIEAVGVEHKETTRNYDILAAVFSDALKFMHDDLGLVGNSNKKKKGGDHQGDGETSSNPVNTESST